MSSYWERELRHRLSRRRVLQGLGWGGVGLAAATLLACNSNDSGTKNGSSAGGSPTGPFNTGTVASTETGDDLRDRFDPNHLRDLPGQKDGPKYGGIHKKQHAPPPSWDWTSPAGGLSSSSHSSASVRSLGMPWRCAISSGTSRAIAASRLLIIQSTIR